MSLKLANLLVLRKGVGSVRVPHQILFLAWIGFIAAPGATLRPASRYLVINPQSHNQVAVISGSVGIGSVNQLAVGSAARQGAPAMLGSVDSQGSTVETPLSPKPIAEDFHSLVQEPSRRSAQRPQFGNPLKDMNQRSSIQMLGAFREAIGSNWKGTVELLSGDQRLAYGAVVDEDGWIVSKDSQIPRTGKLTCRFSNGAESVAVPVEHNQAIDLVLLRVPDRQLETIQWAADMLPQRGNWVATTDTRSIPVAVGVVSAGIMSVAPKKPVLGVLLGDNEFGGAFIRHVLRGTGADLAGLRVGDTIQSINGQRLTDRAAAMSLLESCRAGQAIQLAVVRGNEELDLNAQMMDLADELHDETEMEVNGQVSARSSGFSAVFLHDTVLLPSQCGGPLVDLNGHVVGINIARAGRVTSYALPTATVRPEIERMLKQAKGGQVVQANANVAVPNIDVR